MHSTPTASQSLPREQAAAQIDAALAALTAARRRFNRWEARELRRIDKLCRAINF